MPRSKRTLSNQGLYHVYNRAELGQPIFESDGAKAVFLETILRVSETLAWELHAYAIMTNHFHLALTTPQADIEVGMHALLSGFANKHRTYRGQSATSSNPATEQTTTLSASLPETRSTMFTSTPSRQESCHWMNFGITHGTVTG